MEQSERPWQSDLDQVQHTLQEVLQAMARLTGMELPQAGGDFENIGSSLNRMDFKALKDRIHNELDAFSSTTAAETVRQAQEQARAALEAVRNEVDNQVDQVAGEFREKLRGRLEPEPTEINVAEQGKERITELLRAQTEEFARWYG